MSPKRLPQPAGSVPEGPEYGRPILPELTPPDPGRLSRLQGRIGQLVRHEVIAAARQRRAEEAAQARRAIEGTEGGAHAARPSRREQVATGQRGFGREKATVTRYRDTHLVDRMWDCGQLNDRQHAAAKVVLALHAKAGLEPQVTSSYAPPGWNRGTGDDEENPALTEFRLMLGECSAAHAAILHSMCLSQHPGVARLATLQAALTDLADLWQLR